MKNQKVVFWGAGEHAELIFNIAMSKIGDRELVAFIDSDSLKHGKKVKGIPIISFSEAVKKYDHNFDIYVTANERNTPDIIGLLLEKGVPRERILNYEPVELRCGCAAEGVLLIHFVNESISLTLCDYISRAGENKNRTEYKIAPHEFNLHTFFEKYKLMTDSVNQIAVENIPNECANCKLIEKRYFFKESRIRRLMLGGYTACNYKCLHCTNTELYDRYKSSLYNDLNLVFDVIDSSGLLNDDSVIAFGVGEFTLYKEHDAYLNKISKYPLMLASNGYLYSTGIEHCLSQGNTSVCISVDAGTPETYMKIKGVDGYSQICENIRKYSEHGQVVLKYIMYENINTNNYDMNNFIDFADRYASRTVISRDFYSESPLDDDVLKKVSIMIKHFRDNGKLSAIVGYKRTGEQEMIKNFESEFTYKIANARKFFDDKISLCIFDKRIEIGADIKKQMFPETLEFASVSDDDKVRILHFIEDAKNPEREKFIYGAGIGCRSILEKESVRIFDFKATGIIDNNVKGDRYGLPVLTFSEFLEHHKDALVLNSIGLPMGKQIHEQCINHGVEVVSLFELDKSWNQYFDLPNELGLVDDGEVFVHAGCYNGDTQKSYINWFGETYEKMITFEPNSEQYKFCSNLFKKFRNVEITPFGLSDRTKTVKFEPDIPGRSFIDNDGTVEIEVVSLDEFMHGENVSFIALDIEGEEYKALQGAEQIIRTQKPKLAISCYHKAEDMWELPNLIKSYNPDYKFYLRHYHLFDMAETVLYAL